MHFGSIKLAWLMKIIDDGEKKLNEGVKRSSDDVDVVMDTVMLS